VAIPKTSYERLKIILIVAAPNREKVPNALYQFFQLRYPLYCNINRRLNVRSFHSDIFVSLSQLRQLLL
jgi:hypothetical protein